ncbi:MAG: Hsp70 family protein [Phycisphaerales bacterium]
MKSDPIGTAVDFGDGVIKACLVYPDRLEPLWVDEGSESFANAVYKDPTTGEVTIGRQALAIGAADPEGLAINYKRKIAGDSSKAYFGGTATAADVAVECLRKLREIGEKQSGRTLPPTVFSAPVLASDAQKAITRSAFEKAGFRLFAERGGQGPLLLEPTAAMRAAGDQAGLTAGGSTFLVIDVGSSTTDITAGQFECGQLTVLNHDGDTQLGGQDIRGQLHALALQKASVKPEDFAKVTPEARFQFLLSVENALRALNTAAKTKLVVPMGDGAKVRPVDVSRDEFRKQVVDPFADRVIAAVRRCLKGRNPKDLTRIQVVGGPCANLRLLERLEQELGRKPSSDVNPTMAIVRGLALHARELAARDAGTTKAFSIFVREIVPINVGIAVHHGDSKQAFCHVLFPKGTPANSEVVEDFWLLESHQHGASIHILQGEEGQPEEQCHCIGAGQLKDLPPEAVRTQRLEVRGIFDAAGMVRLYVTDKVSGKRLELSAQITTAARTSAA